MENNELKEKSDSESKHDKASAQEYENLLREKICLTIRNRMKKAQKYSSYDIKEYKVFFLSFQERSELIRVIDIYCPGFQRELKKRHPELNRNDILLCRFYLLDLSILQTAILLGTDYSSIRKRTSRLKEKIGDSEIHQYLKSLFFAF